MLNVIFFLGGFVVAVFFFCFHSYIYISIAFRFIPFILVIRSLICLFALLCLFVSVFLALLVSLFIFHLSKGVLMFDESILRFVSSLNINIISIPLASVWKCWRWSLKGKSISDREMWRKAKFESTQRCAEVMKSVKVRQKLNLSVSW